MGSIQSVVLKLHHTAQLKFEGNVSAFVETAFRVNAEYAGKLISVLPHFYQHVTCATRGKLILDHLYSTHRDAYKALPRPPFGKSVKKTFKQVNIHKAAGPDRLLGRVLRACTEQLASLFTDIFNLFLSESVIPTCFKQTTILPVPKNTKVICLFNYLPVAFTSVAMKCFERLVMAHITIIPETLDPLQFAYSPNRSTDDAISIALHTALSHLDKRNTYVRMLLIDYSSVFNTIVPSKLITKLRTLRLNNSLCNWILDFLMGRPQVVM